VLCPRFCADFAIEQAERAFRLAALDAGRDISDATTRALLREVDLAEARYRRQRYFANGARRMGGV
jgi:hypothetical protein